MNDEDTGSGIKRILVALDTSLHGPLTVEAATRLAARLRAELFGLFVEDSDLLRLAELPFAQEIAFSSAKRRAIDSPGMERALRAQAEELRRRFEASAARARVSASFRVARGDLLTELLTRAPETDLLVLGEIERAWRSARRLESLAHQVLLQASCSVLLHRRAVETARPVMVMFEDAPTGRRAVTLAAQLAESGADDLILLIPPVDEGRAAEIQAHAARWLGGRPANLRLRRLEQRTAAALAAAVRAERARLLVFTADGTLAALGAGSDLLGAIDCAVVLVR